MARTKNYDFFGIFTYFVPSVADMFILLGMLLFGVVLGNLASLAVTLIPGAGMSMAMLVAYPVMFIPAMLYASVQSRRKSYNSGGILLDNGNFAPVGGFLCAAAAVAATFCVAFCSDAFSLLLPEPGETFKKLTGIRLMEGFGQTETTLTVATMPWMEPKPGSMGLPNPQYDVDLIDHDGRSVEAGEQGQIVIRTDKGKPLGLFKEYYRDAERTREAWHDGIYYTGDVAWKDEDGYLWFVGRADDVIKSSGYRIGPFEVESALMTHPAVVECAITGVPDEIRGQVVKATIVLSKAYKDKAGDALIKELQNHVKRVTAPYKYPRVIEFVDELPKTISGKIRRVEIRKNDEK